MQEGQEREDTGRSSVDRGPSSDELYKIKYKDKDYQQIELDSLIVGSILFAVDSSKMSSFIKSD